ncbi:MAG: hypothetical protein K2X93_04225, partial [Candidatus Obscuribacterales bacterium]|nr:hypothetical protein [Candidatus Obscuribacterales bacterium]
HWDRQRWYRASPDRLPRVCGITSTLRHWDRQRLAAPSKPRPVARVSGINSTAQALGPPAPRGTEQAPTGCLARVSGINSTAQALGPPALVPSEP